MDRQLAGLVDAIAAGEQRGTAARERAATALADPAVTRAVRDDEESKAVDAGDGSILRRVSR
jgi:isoaspartyl peptidase/L-asparaginase-like protein (Ntn-hydrolase superfamily)